jgi:hypothetical protein
MHFEHRDNPIAVTTEGADGRQPMTLKPGAAVATR